jgi:phytoene synthase
VTGKVLAGLEDGWATLLDELPDEGRIRLRGERLFAIGGGLLGGADPLLAAAGRLFSGEQVRRKRLEVASNSVSLEELAGHRFSRPLRPLTGLARLAARDAKRILELEPEATPGRAAALLSHRLFGTIA